MLAVNHPDIIQSLVTKLCHFILLFFCLEFIHIVFHMINLMQGGELWEFHSPTQDEDRGCLQDREPGHPHHGCKGEDPNVPSASQEIHVFPEPEEEDAEYYYFKLL